MKFEELVNKLKEINSLEELPNYQSINSNVLIYAIYKSGRYDLFKNNDIRLNLKDRKTLEKLMDYFLDDEDILFYMFHNGFSFTKEELEMVFKFSFQKYQYTYELDKFFRNCFIDNGSLNDFIKNHKSFFMEYLRVNGRGIFGELKDCDAFVKLILESNCCDLIENIEDYSLDNIKLLLNILKRGVKLSYYEGNYDFAQKIFELKDNFTFEEFWYLLNLLEDKICYDKIDRKSGKSLFSNLISANIDYLIELVDATSIPKCLVDQPAFRDLCIKKKRIDLAVKCVLPIEILQNEELMIAYANELGMDLKEFYVRCKEILEYKGKNENIFNTILATSLQDNIYTLNSNHLERFINDIPIQMSIAKLDAQELQFLKRVLNFYDYRDYDIALMVENIIKNMLDYTSLIHDINPFDISEETLKKLVKILQVPGNPYHIDNFYDLDNYAAIKRQHFLNDSEDLDSVKDKLLMCLFNIGLQEAKYIDYKYCHGNGDNNILDELKESELPEKVYNYLILINKIVTTNDIADLIELYNKYCDEEIYDLEIPFESYLRAFYTELYSKSLYQIEKKENVYGPRDSIINTINFHQKKIKACVPRENFRFLIHCIGYCTKTPNDNYRKEWLDRPLLQDHFVACSYISEKGIFSLQNQDEIIFGFANLENGAILGMGNTDIDSIGRYAEAYAGSRELQEGNRARARYFVPSQLLKTINDYYNEIVIERRNPKVVNSEIKRKPDYIVMIVDSLKPENFNYLDNLYRNELAFVFENDRILIRSTFDKRELRKILLKYVKEVSKLADLNDLEFSDMLTVLIDKIKRSLYFENSLKAADDFSIPIVIIDRSYYFKKLLAESSDYDTEIKTKIWNSYKTTANDVEKAKIFNEVAKSADMTKFIDTAESRKKIPETNQATSMKR